MIKPQKTTVTVDLGVLGERDILVHYFYSPGRPGRMYMSNGDPGYPDDPAELEIVKVEGVAFEEELLEYINDSDDICGQIVEEIEVDRRADEADYYYDLKKDEALHESP